MNKEQELKTMIVLSLALLILFIIFKLKVFLLLVAIFLLLALIGGKPSYLISKYWVNFAEFLGKVNSKVIIFITYYLFITPFAIIYRLFNKKQVCDFFDKKEDSLYISLSSENTAFEDIHFFFNLFFGLKNKFLAFNGLLFKDLKLIIFFFLLSIFIDESKFEDIF